MDPAAERRARLEVRLHRTLAAHEEADRAYWRALPPGERVLLTWALSEEQWRLRGEFPDERGLCRSVARLRRP